jgi:hypothetical protein
MTAQTSRTAAGLGLLALVVALFGVRALLGLATPAAHDLVHPQGLRGETAFHIGASVTFGLLYLAALIAIMRVQKIAPSAIGLGVRARWPGWVAATLVAAAFIGFTAMGPMFKGVDWAGDWSLFRIGGAVAVALVGGVIEETAFRGFVMERARALGLNAPLQIILSGLLFGLAHVGWGGLTGGGFQLYAAIGAMVSTAVLGMLLATAFLLSGRSLAPVILAHGVIDLVIEPWLMMYAVGGGLGRP